MRDYLKSFELPAAKLNGHDVRGLLRITEERIDIGDGETIAGRKGFEGILWVDSAPDPSIRNAFDEGSPMLYDGIFIDVDEKKREGVAMVTILGVDLHYSAELDSPFASISVAGLFDPQMFEDERA